MSRRREIAAALGLCGLLLTGTVGAAPDESSLRRGEQVYARCAACHAIEANRTGPQHCGPFGRHAGTAPGYDGYSEAMRSRMKPVESN